ncbi:heterokaryon incompatibility protein [Apiospora rasikravindrae]|uniref:Heterokaryon incompatibility protein n=1 Tax=Apiospora rasikravindrae TaxID=990691 RepID=A0ABR1TYS1_9PEZI
MLSKHFKKAAAVPCEPPPRPPHPYLPLQGDEIRLLTINPVSPDLESISQISCNLQHVDLPNSGDSGADAGVADSGLYRGYARDWPELETAPETSQLFKSDAWVKKQDLSKYEEKVRQPIESSDGGPSLTHEEQHPWRHSWGDYVALSYVWGPQTPAKTILIDGLPFDVGPNLYLALEQLRRSQRIRQGFKVWIDAICINQQDIGERSHQVGRMRDIYASAWQVVSWLGGTQDDSDLAIDALRYMARLPTEPSEIEGMYRVKRGMDVRPLFITWDSYESPFRNEVFKAVLGFFTRPYWRRMWILQEIAMAQPEAPVLCGGKCLSWAEIRDAARLITADEERFGRLITGTLPSTWNFEIGQARLSERRHLSPERLWRLMTELLRVQSDQTDAPLPGATTDILKPLLLARDAAVTQEKDRVYGILGIKAVAERVSLTPDYTLPLSVNFQTFSSALLLGGSLDLLRLGSLLDKPIYTKGSLSTLGSRVLEAAPCIHNLPSWVVCWTCAALPVANLRAAYHAGGKPTVESRPPIVVSDSCLRIQGLIVDTIVSVGTCHPAEATDDCPVSGPKGRTSAYGELDGTREALWRTIVGNSTAQGDCPAPEEYSWLLDPRIWRDAVSGVVSHGLGLESVMKKNGSLDLCGYSLKELIFGPGRTRRPWGNDTTIQPRRKERLWPGPWTYWRGGG